MRLCLRVLLISSVAGAVFGVRADLLIGAQIQAVNPQIRHNRGQNVVPVYEGWFRAADGQVHVSFGYLNRNTDEAIDIPSGPNNRVDPGPADEGQPTHFAPGRHYGVFTVPVPKKTPKTEFRWSLTVEGQVVSIPANLDPVYLIDALKEVGGDSPGNTPPALRLDAQGAVSQGPRGVTVDRRASVSVPLTLDVWVTDDGLPSPTQQAVVSPSRARLSVTWSHYRGVGQVTFGTTSPLIERGKATTTVMFDQPGEYVLRALASDGSSFSGQCCWTNSYVRVIVAGTK